MQLVSIWSRSMLLNHFRSINRSINENTRYSFPQEEAWFSMESKDTSAHQFGLIPYQSMDESINQSMAVPPISSWLWIVRRLSSFESINQSIAQLKIAGHERRSRWSQYNNIFELWLWSSSANLIDDYVMSCVCACIWPSIEHPIAIDWLVMHSFGLQIISQSSSSSSVNCGPHTHEWLNKQSSKNFRSIILLLLLINSNWGIKGFGDDDDELATSITQLIIIKHKEGCRNIGGSVSWKISGKNFRSKHWTKKFDQKNFFKIWKKF